MFNFDSEFEVKFSLINEVPEKFPQSKWNIDFCIESYFQNIINQFANYTRFTLTTQVLLYSEFSSYTNKKQSSLLSESDVPVMTNNIESRLGSRISDNSAIEFVTYVPSSKQPLYIMSKENESKQVAFMIPRWGGIYIYNHDDETKAKKGGAEEERDLIRVNQAVQTFLSQFIDLIGIEMNQNQNEAGKTYERSGIYSTELYGYLATKTLENQLSSLNTLRSLASLLTQISSMVIEDSIAAQVSQAVESLRLSVELTRKGGRQVEAFHAAKRAFEASERAFFNPSLLDRLYFPEDQRFAVYIPLFIPVGMPIVFSLKALLTWVKQTVSSGRQQKLKTE